MIQPITWAGGFEPVAVIPGGRVDLDPFTRVEAGALDQFKARPKSVLNTASRNPLARLVALLVMPLVLMGAGARGAITKL